LPRLRQAILDQRTVRFRYHARASAEDGEAPSERTADPYALIHLGTTWYLTAYCHLRQGIRHFRLERMENLTVLDRDFTRPADFDLRPSERDDPRTYVVRALFDPAVARWVREAPSFFTTGTESTPEGLLVTLQARQEQDVVQWLLGWGAHVRILEPDSLRARLAVEATAMLQQYTREGG
jgi:predicted DNA-binding transcriptional regulator YafY